MKSRSAGESLTIGELCERTGEAPHVLRHWEDVGLLRPRRTPAGHRRYDPATVAAVHTVRRLQRVGLSLPEILALHRSGKPARRAKLDAHLARLAEDRAAIDAATAFLTHISDCTHAVVDDCPGCASFAAGEAAS